MAIQNILDMGSQIFSSLGKNNCETFTDIFIRLGEENIIPNDFSLKIKGMAGLRNILVHDYLQIDNEKLFNVIQNQLQDFEEFIKYILKYIN